MGERRFCHVDSSSRPEKREGRSRQCLCELGHKRKSAIPTLRLPFSLALAYPVRVSPPFRQSSPKAGAMRWPSHQILGMVQRTASARFEIFASALRVSGLRGFRVLEKLACLRGLGKPAPLYPAGNGFLCGFPACRGLRKPSFPAGKQAELDLEGGSPATVAPAMAEEALLAIQALPWQAVLHGKTFAPSKMPRRPVAGVPEPWHLLGALPP